MTSTQQDGTALPERQTELPGPRSVALVDVLARHESPGITFRRARMGEARGVGADPIVWERAVGANVWDADGNRYVDLTGAFGVALIGHAHPQVVAAVQEQAGRLLHGMGDVFPNGPRIALMKALGELAPGDLSQCILGSSGSEAVEAALKTGALYSGRAGVLAFWGAYHGLTYGALAATAYKDDFRRPFLGQMGRHVVHMPYGEHLDLLERLLEGPATGGEAIGTILVEPILGRGGEVVAPAEWLQGLRRLADKHRLCLVFDEIYSGLGRTGRWWAGDHSDVTPDVVCVGKALGGGMPVSAAVARPEVMAAWGASKGEAIHTSTFLGHPVAAAAALAALDVMQQMDAPAVSARLEQRVRKRLEPLGLGVRGRGAMLAVETGQAGRAATAAGDLLKAGYIVLPGGVAGDVIGLTPPLSITDTQLNAALDALVEALDVG